MKKAGLKWSPTANSTFSRKRPTGERAVVQEALFYSFSLDRRVAVKYFLRSIDRVVDLSGIREEPHVFYSETGRPSIFKYVGCFSGKALLADRGGFEIQEDGHG